MKIILTIIEMLPLINFIIGKSSKSFFGFPTYKIISINIFIAFLLSFLPIILIVFKQMSIVNKDLAFEMYPYFYEAIIRSFTLTIVLYLSTIITLYFISNIKFYINNLDIINTISLTTFLLIFLINTIQ